MYRCNLGILSYLLLASCATVIHVCLHLLTTLMKMVAFKIGVVLFMIGLCWSSGLHSADENTETLDDSTSQRGTQTAVTEKWSCPTWYRAVKDSEVTRCVCDATFEYVVMCDEDTQQTLILGGYCMSYDYTLNDTIIGRCPFNYHYPDTQIVYITLPNDTSELNSFMCNGLNRTGLLCSQCQQGLGPAVISYKRECVKCFEKQYGWLLYITATLIPTTVLCFLVIIFQFHITSPEMNAFVFLCQFVTCADTLTNPYIFVHYTSNLTAIRFIELSLTTFYGIWNLDFFRYLIPSFCISSDMSTLHTIALEYVVAIYPLLLTILIYLCIEMYDSGVRVMVCVWRPFHACFARFRRKWDLKGNVIHAFATFLLLSYSKLLTVSYSLLDANILRNNRGKRFGPAVLYYDASVEYFSRQHLPFAMLAICVLLVFVLFPLLLLLLYPMRSFQRCLGYCTRIRWQFLHTFADAFQGYYKNGTNGTWDYRYFAGLYLLFRIVLLVAFIISMTYQWLILIPLPIFVSLMFAYFRPYKNNYFNIIDCLAFVLLVLTIFLIMYAIRANPFPLQILYVVGLIPFLYFISFVLYKLLPRVALFRTCCSKIGKVLQARNKNQHLHIQRDDEDLPDRIVNPDMYQPLLPATNNGEGNSQTDTQPQAGVNSLVAYGSI